MRISGWPNWWKVWGHALINEHWLEAVWIEADGPLALAVRFPRMLGIAREAEVPGV
jgi:hypothetical protein